MEHDPQDDAGLFRFSPRPNRAGEIDWSPWGEEAFLRAERERKPVLLSISAVWCHWCHVMDETTYSDAEVIDLINRLYVPVRVDADREPDINRRYNQGGWPTTAFLSSRGALLAGTTYIPPDRMRLVLRRIYELYDRDREELERTSLAITSPSRSRGELSPTLVEGIAASLLAAWDRRFGGLGREPKFPLPEALDLALHAYRRGLGEEYRALAESSLAAIMDGNLRDRVEGGFFRYSTTRDWSVPHYEKMLADNAGLLSTLLRAYGATGKRAYLDTAAETAWFIRRTLSDGKRFFGSQDADEEYYLLDSEARRRRPAPQVDDTVYVDASARAALSLLQAWAALGEVAFRNLALDFLDFAWSQCYLPQGGMAHYHHQGSAGRRGLLDDQVEAALAFQQAFSLTGDSLHLERAETLLSPVRDAFWDAENKLLLDTIPGFSPPGLQPAAADIPSVSRAAEAFLRQHYLQGRMEWKIAASDLLSSVAGEAERAGFVAAPFALVLDMFLEGPLLVSISGSDAGLTRKSLFLAAISPDHRVIILLGKGGSGEKGRSEVEVCGEGACYLRTGRPEELAGYLGIEEGII